MPGNERVHTQNEWKLSLESKSTADMSDEVNNSNNNEDDDYPCERGDNDNTTKKRVIITSSHEPNIEEISIHSVWLSYFFHRWLYSKVRYASVPEHWTAKSAQK